MTDPVTIPIPDDNGALTLWHMLHLPTPPPQLYSGTSQNSRTAASLRVMEGFDEVVQLVHSGFDVTKLTVPCEAVDGKPFTVDFKSFAQALKDYKVDPRISLGAVLSRICSGVNAVAPPTDADWVGDQASFSPHWRAWHESSWDPGYTTETELYPHLAQVFFEPPLAAAAAIVQKLRPTAPNSFKPVYSLRVFQNVQTGVGSIPDLEPRLAKSEEDFLKHKQVTVATGEVKPTKVAQPFLELLEASQPFVLELSSIEDSTLRDQMSVCREIVAQVWGQMNDKELRFGVLITESQFVLFYRPTPDSLQYSVVYDRRAPRVTDVAHHHTLVYLTYMFFLSLTKTYGADEAPWARFTVGQVHLRAPSMSQDILASPTLHPSQGDTTIYRCILPDPSLNDASIYRRDVDCIIKITNTKAGYERFEHEARCYKTLRSMQGKGVPRCLGLLAGGYKSLLLFTEYSGEPIQDFLQLSIAQRLSLLSILLNIHKLGIVHCDLEPRNILLDRHNRVVVIDFGFAHLSHVCRGFKYCTELRSLRHRLRLTTGDHKRSKLVSALIDLLFTEGAGSVTVLMGFITAELIARLSLVGLCPTIHHRVSHLAHAIGAFSAVWLVVLVCVLAFIALLVSYSLSRTQL